MSELSKEEALKLVMRRETLLGVIADSYRRMATNTDSNYRDQQVLKCQNWLDELTELNAKDPTLFSITSAQLFL